MEDAERCLLRAGPVRAAEGRVGAAPIGQQTLRAGEVPAAGIEPRRLGEQRQFAPAVAFPDGANVAGGEEVERERRRGRVEGAVPVARERMRRAHDHRRFVPGLGARRGRRVLGQEPTRGARAVAERAPRQRPARRAAMPGREQDGPCAQAPRRIEQSHARGPLFHCKAHYYTV